MGNTSNGCKRSAFAGDINAGQFDVQRFDDGNTNFYDYYRYTKSRYQPQSLKSDEEKLECYVTGCNNHLRIRPNNSGIWVVTDYSMHDASNGFKHNPNCTHKRHTPNSIHKQNICKAARNDAMLTKKTLRQACEDQILQNPNLNKVTSVQKLQAKLRRITGNTLLQFPPNPSCPASAAISLKNNPIWAQNLYAHCEHVLRQKIKNINVGNHISFELDMDDLLTNGTITQEQRLLKSQLQLQQISLQIAEVTELLKLLRMSVNGADKTCDFLIHMRLNGTLMIFGHRCGFRILKQCTMLGFDQLCKVVPNLGNKKGWNQSWWLHGMYESKSIDIMDENFPAFMCLMDDHIEETYLEILDLISDYAKRNIDPMYGTLTAKLVRLMGDFSMGEHKALVKSEHITVLKDDGCGWHFIQAVNDNMISKGVIEYYHENDMFRMFIRKFVVIRAIHLDCAIVACNLVKRKSWNEIYGSAKRVFREFFTWYLEPIWKDRFGFELLNCQGSFVMDNNFSEGYNYKALIDIGINESWYAFLWNFKRYFAIVAARFEAFEVNGFERKRSKPRRERCAALEKVWNKFENLDRTNEEIVWSYVNCLYFIYENDYNAFEDLLNTL